MGNPCLVGPNPTLSASRSRASSIPASIFVFPPMKNYEAVLFDVDDTLLDFAASEASACRYTFEHLPDPPALPFDSFTAQFHHIEDAMWDLYMAGTIHRTDVLPATFARLAAGGGLGRSDPAAAAAMFWNRFVLHSVPEPLAHQVLTDLSHRCRLGIVSNYEIPAIQRQRLASTGLAPLFEVVVISGDIGIEKPDPGIFDAALRQLRLQPHQCLFVGDSVSTDAAGARAAGLDFCWYTRHHADSSLAAPCAITSLMDLLAFPHIRQHR